MAKKILKITEEDEFWHVRFRSPSMFNMIRTPNWAARVARSHSKGAEVRMGRTDAGNWLVQSVLIRRGHGKNRNDVRRLGRKIQREIDD